MLFSPYQSHCFHVSAELDESDEFDAEVQNVNVQGMGGLKKWGNSTPPHFSYTSFLKLELTNKAICPSFRPTHPLAQTTDFANPKHSLSKSRQSRVGSRAASRAASDIYSKGIVENEVGVFSQQSWFWAFFVS